MKLIAVAILIVGALVAGSIVYASRSTAKPEAACHFYDSDDGVRYHRERCEASSPWKLVR